MNQFIGEFKFYEVSNGLRKRRDGISHLTLINDPVFYNSSTLNIPEADTTTFYEIKNINFIYLFSNYNFNLLLDNSIAMNLKQFVFLNDNRYISVAIQCNPLESQQISFVYGVTRYGLEGPGLGSIGNAECAATWDVVLKNIILKVDNDTNVVDVVYPRTSSIVISG